MNLLAPGSVVVLLSLVGLAVTLAYYLRPSRGQHADPRGAATTVAALCADHRLAATAPTVPLMPIRRSPYGLLCGYEDLPTVVIDDFDPESFDAPAIVRPYLLHRDNGEPVATFVPLAPTQRLSPCVWPRARRSLTRRDPARCT